MDITGKLSAASVSGKLAGRQNVTGAIGIPKVAPAPTYGGPYEVTPGASAVVLETNGLQMAQNVTVNPIPSNYGLITWDGSTLTVS